MRDITGQFDPEAGTCRLSADEYELGSNENGSIGVACKGRIHNASGLFSRLRARGHHLQSQKQADLIAQAYQEYGDNFVSQLNGPFALALWDASQHQLILARDRVGMETLFYCPQSGKLTFASLLSSILAQLSCPPQINYDALDQFLTFEYIFGPQTIYQGILRLPAAHMLTVSPRGTKLRSYWEPGAPDTTTGLDGHLEQLRTLLQDAIEARIPLPGPPAVLLSGGTDSSTIAALCARASGRLQSFALGFEDQAYDELARARRVAAHFGSRHHSAVLSSGAVPVLAQEIAGALEEPLADSSLFPTIVLSRFVRAHTSMVLAGDGGDELFGGYDEYVAELLHRYCGQLPEALGLKVILRIARGLRPSNGKKTLVNKFKRFAEGMAHPVEFAHFRWRAFLSADDKLRLYTHAFREALVPGEGAEAIISYINRVRDGDAAASLTRADLATHLPEGMLGKLRAASRLSGLEVRLPFLDAPVVDFALTLPGQLKLRLSKRKYLLKRALQDILPTVSLKGPKQGFSAPMRGWLRTVLKPMMDDVLSPECLRRRGLFQIEEVTQLIDEHMTGRANHSHRLWPLMLLELWLREHVD